MVRFFVFFLLVLSISRPIQADTSWFSKLVVLRFGHEEIVTAQQGLAAVGTIRTDRYYHIQGTIPLITGEFLEPRFLEDAELSQLLEAHKATENLMRLKTYPYAQPADTPTTGTFILKVKRQSGTPTVLNIPRFFHPLDVYYVSRTQVRRILSHEKLDPRPENNRNSNRYHAPNLDLPDDDEFILYAHASSPLIQGRSVLNFTSLFLGDRAYWERVQILNRLALNGMAGGFFVVFIFYAFISVFRPKDRPSRYLSIYALASFGLSQIQILDFTIDTPRLIDYFTILNLIAVGALQLYTLDKVKTIMNRSWTRRFKMLAILVAVGASLGILLNVRGFVSPLLMTSFLGGMILIGLTVYVGIRHRMEGTEYFMVGAALSLMFQYPTLVTYVTSRNIENGFYILLANFSIAIALALVNAKDFAVTYHNLDEKNREITFLNRNLENLVDVKTREVRSLLDHIPQGVLSLNKEGQIEKDFSAHLVEILGTEDIAGRSFQDLVLRASDCSRDTQDQIWQTLRNCLGDSELNFELNADKLPNTLALRIACMT